MIESVSPRVCGSRSWLHRFMAAALLLGWFVGYERYFSGRAAGSQVYCLVCATSCAVTLLAGYPAMWYWGSETTVIAADPTKVISAILTGIGFLGAGLIVKSGHNVRGLTTAASIWGSSAIGILVGVGFYVRGGLGGIGHEIRCPLPITVTPLSLTVKPLRRSSSGSMPIRQPFST